MNFFMYSMGDKSGDIFLSFKLPVADAQKYCRLCVAIKFTMHFIPTINTIFEKSRFNTRVQQNGESVEEFITAL